MPKQLNIREVIRDNPLSPGNGWNPLEYPVNFCLLGGQKSPGLFLIDKGSFKAKWQRAPQPGLAGEALRYLGEACVEFSGTVFLVTAYHWAQWDQWIKLFDRPKRGTVPRALSWWHPLTQCRTRPVREVVVDEYEIPKHQGGGLWTSTIQFVEHWVPKVAASKPEPAATEELDPVDAEIKAKTEVVNDLAKIAGRKR